LPGQEARRRAAAAFELSPALKSIKMEAQLRSDGDEVALLQTHMAQRWQDKFALDPLLINDIRRPHVAGGERAVTLGCAR
jgi:hypothetical protein